MGAHLLTEKGKKALGLFLKDSREKRGLSMAGLVTQIAEKTGSKLSASQISTLERGHVDQPGWDVIAILAATGYAINPLTKKPFEPHELFHIACEQIHLPTDKNE